MDLVIELLQYIISQGINYTIGEDAFVCKDTGALKSLILTEYAGVPLGDDTTTSFRNVQVKVRNTSVEECWNDILAIYSLFNNKRTLYIKDRWMQIDVKQTPFCVGFDDKQCVTFIFNMQITTFIRRN